jgi:UDP-N-acetylmuramoyl-tripeptide--D-alanyl-D-alanine ligase|tara:strand:+ start:1276 stop:2625 length:1350 start_codon:yes stop_codon:yes gene_type:complete
MISLTLRDLASIAELSFNSSMINEGMIISSFSIDSRTLKKGDAYIAIEGTQFDGNNFIQEAIDKGASMAFTSNAKLLSPKIFYIHDGKNFLKKIASFILKKINPKVIAITGSNGKTTTKEIIAAIFRQELCEDQFLVSAGNFNNDIGLPLTILRLNENHKIVILEMGMNHAGEIEELTKIAPPDIAVITNIGEAHIQNFNSKDGIASAKKEILCNISINGSAIIPRDDDYYSYLIKGLSALKVTTFGMADNSDIYCNIQNDLTMRYYILGETFDASCKLIGDHNISNMLAAIAVASCMNVPINSIKKGIESMQPVQGRLEVKRSKNGATIIDDTYNANPSSMKAAIDTLSKFKSQQKIIVLGDMGELGSQSNEFHDDVISYINSSNIHFTLAIGENMKASMTKSIKQGKWYESKEDLLDSLSKLMNEDSVILVKGSRFMKMEEIINKIL